MFIINLTFIQRNQLITIIELYLNMEFELYSTSTHVWNIFFKTKTILFFTQSTHTYTHISTMQDLLCAEYGKEKKKVCETENASIFQRNLICSMFNVNIR